MSVPWPISYEEFKAIYSKVPRLCVDLIIHTDQGYLMTLRENPRDGWVGQWHFPGGTVYMYESLEDALRRKAEEELGIEIEIEKLLGYTECHSERKERGFGYSVGLEFLCHITKGEPDGRGGKVGFFTTPPENTILEHKEFFQGHLLGLPSSQK